MTRLILLLIILASFGLRVWGIGFGLPFAYHPDEQQYIIPAMRVVSGNFEPWAHYNPALYPYLIGGVYAATYAGLSLFDAFPPFFNLATGWTPQMQPWTAGMIFLARYVTVAMGVFTTLALYHLGRRAYSRETGLIAALIFGLTFLPVREAHFAVSDAPVALAVVVMLYLCLGIIERGHWPTYLGAGVALGLAAATKYSAGLLVIPLGVAHLASHRYDSWRARILSGWKVILAGLVSLVTFALASPYTLIQFAEFWEDFSENLVSAREGFQGLDLDPAGGAVFYLKGLGWGFGWPVVIVFGLGIVVALWRRRRFDIVLVVFALFGFFYMQRQAMYFVRWLMPFVPALVLLAAETMRQATALASKRRFAPVLLALLLTLPSTITAGYASYIFNQPDTRTQAYHWIRDNIPPGSTIAAELLSPPWGPPLTMPGLSVGPYNYAPTPDGGIAELPLEHYQAMGVQYVVASSFYYARPLLDKTRQAQLATNLARLDEVATLVITFEPYVSEPGFFYHDQVYGPANDVWHRRQPGPTIRIYRLP